METWYGIRRVLSVPTDVSMEPRFFNHGDGISPRHDIIYRLLAFQWSHGSSTMETVLLLWLRLADGGVHVSMEPRFFNHGDVNTSGSRWDLGSPVSMEPRFFNHGDRPASPTSSRQCRAGFNGATVFQPWRPAYNLAPPRRPQSPVVSMEPRFFNHGDQTAQTRLGQCLRARFNGATVFQPWRQRSVRPGPQRRGRVSMEPRFFNHGDL